MAIPLGWEYENSPSFGFHVPAPASNELITYDGDAPVCVIAPTGAGKGRDFLVPLLLSYDGPMNVLDLKGELSAITRRTRNAMGQGATSSIRSASQASRAAGSTRWISSPSKARCSSRTRAGCPYRDQRVPGAIGSEPSNPC